MTEDFTAILMKLREVEDDVRALIEEAQDRANKILEEAQSSSYKIFREAYLAEVRRIEEEASKIIEDARIEAEREASTILKESEELLEGLKRRARERFEEAVELVLKEIMGG